MSEHGARMAMAMMSALGGGASMPRWKGRKAKVPNPEREAAAQAKRARKAAKRERDAERTREGRDYGRSWVSDSWGGWETPRGRWDDVEMYWRGYYDWWNYEPRWRQRAAYCRSLPMALPWFCTAATQVRRALRLGPAVIDFGRVSIWVRGEFVGTCVDSDEIVPRGRTRPRYVWPWVGPPRLVERPPLVDVRCDGMVFR